MDIARLSLEFVRAIAWPIVVLAAVLVFRRELSALLSRLRTMKLPGGAEFNFNEAVISIEKSSKETSRSLRPPGGRQPLAQNVRQRVNSLIQDRKLMVSQSGYDLAYYLDIAQSDPNLALAGIRMELERMFRNMLVLDGEDLDRKRLSAGQYLSILRTREMIPASMYQLLSQTIEVGNAAVHVSDIDKDLSLRVINSLKVFVAFYLNWIQSNYIHPGTKEKAIGAGKKAPTSREHGAGLERGRKRARATQ